MFCIDCDDGWEDAAGCSPLLPSLFLFNWPIDVRPRTIDSASAALTSRPRTPPPGANRRLPCSLTKIGWCAWLAAAVWLSWPPLFRMRFANRSTAGFLYEWIIIRRIWRFSEPDESNWSKLRMRFCKREREVEVNVMRNKMEEYDKDWSAIENWFRAISRSNRSCSMNFSVKTSLKTFHFSTGLKRLSSSFS